MNSRIQEYAILLDLLAKANDSVEGSSISDASERERLLDAHQLANKFIGHALTILHLSHGTIIQDLPSFKKLIFPDYASINVLTRAVMEAFLIFHYVFYAPETQEERDYRYLSYKVAGLAEGQLFPAPTEEYKKKRDSAKKMLSELQDKLRSNTVFQSLTEKQQKKVSDGKGEWKWKPDGKGAISWRNIAIDAGFSEMIASHMYRHLSGHAHTSSLSVLQAQQAIINKEREKLIMPSIDTLNILVANMVKEYCALFSNAQDVLNKSSVNELVNTWIEIGTRLDEGMDRVENNDKSTYLTKHPYP